jgi:hypothetical protein
MSKQSSTKQATVSPQTMLMAAAATFIELLRSVMAVPYISACQAVLVAKKRKVLQGSIKEKVLESAIEEERRVSSTKDDGKKGYVSKQINGACHPSPLAKKALKGTLKAKTATQSSQSQVPRKALESTVEKIQVTMLHGAELENSNGDGKDASASPDSTPAPHDLTASTIQKWWRKRRHRNQTGKIMGLCKVGSRMAKIFREACLEDDEFDPLAAPMVTKETDPTKECDKLSAARVNRSLGPRLANIFLVESLGYVEIDACMGARLAKGMEMDSFESDVEEVPSIKAARSQRGKRAASPDGSTSAGTSSESEDENASEWMSEMAWRPPPGLPAPLHAPPGLEMELPDPWLVH